MIICHEFTVLNQPPLANITLTIAIVECQKTYSVIIVRSEMSLNKSKSVKRPHPEPSGPVKPRDQQARPAPPTTEPDHRATTPASSSGVSWYSADINASFRAAIRPAKPSSSLHAHDEGRQQDWQDWLNNLLGQVQPPKLISTSTLQCSSFNLVTWPGCQRRPGSPSTGTSPAPTAPPQPLLLGTTISPPWSRELLLVSGPRGILCALFARS